MNEIQPSGISALQEFSVENRRPDDSENKELGQDAFLRLMITQMENQSPLDPQENTEFISQLAQFSSVESLDKLNNNFDSFAGEFVANQALQASSLVGRSVSVPADTTILEPGGVVTASVDVPASTSDLSVDIYNASGSLVDQIPIGDRPQGEMILRWDGQYAEVNGESFDWQSSQPEGLPAGEYRFEISASLDGKNTQLGTNVSANVNSVTVGANGALTLNLAGVGAVALSDVRQFNE